MQAAEELREVAGPLAHLLFSLGILTTGLLAVPALAGSAAFAVGEGLGWPVGLARAPGEARAFYECILVYQCGHGTQEELAFSMFCRADQR